MIYNTTNMTGVVETAKAVNDLTHEGLAVGIVLLVFLISLGISLIAKYDTNRAIFGSAFLASVPAFILFLMGWLLFGKLLVLILIIGAFAVIVKFTG